MVTGTGRPVTDLPVDCTVSLMHGRGSGDSPCVIFLVDDVISVKA